MASKANPGTSQPNRKRPAEDDEPASSPSLSAKKSRRISAKPVLRKKSDQSVKAKDAKAMKMPSAKKPHRISAYPVPRNCMDQFGRWCRGGGSGVHAKDAKAMKMPSAKKSRRISAKPILSKKSGQSVQAKDAKAMKMPSRFISVSSCAFIERPAHCVYCCKSFDTRYCSICPSIRHDWDREIVYGSLLISCRICGESISGTGYDDEVELGDCYGPHNSSDDALRRVMEWKKQTGGYFDCAVCKERAEKIQGKGGTVQGTYY